MHQQKSNGVDHPKDNAYRTQQSQLDRWRHEPNVWQRLGVQGIAANRQAKYRNSPYGSARRAAVGTHIMKFGLLTTKRALNRGQTTPNALKIQ